jgi:HNH endonuclease
MEEWVRRFGASLPMRMGHRLAWLYMHGHFPDGLLDHKTRNPSSCRIADLREATSRQNNANTKVRKDSRSGLKGAYQRGHRWTAAVQHNGRRIYIGIFDTPEAAHTAYCGAAKRLHGEFFHDGKA